MKPQWLNPKFTFQHAEEHPADWSDLNEIFKLIGADETSMDYKEALQKWLDSRRSQQQ